MLTIHLSTVYSDPCTRDFLRQWIFRGLQWKLHTGGKEKFFGPFETRQTNQRTNEPATQPFNQPISNMSHAWTSVTVAVAISQYLVSPKPWSYRSQLSHIQRRCLHAPISSGHFFSHSENSWNFLVHEYHRMNFIIVCHFTLEMMKTTRNDEQTENCSHISHPKNRTSVACRRPGIDGSRMAATTRRLWSEMASKIQVADICSNGPPQFKKWVICQIHCKSVT